MIKEFGLKESSTSLLVGRKGIETRTLSGGSRNVCLSVCVTVVLDSLMVRRITFITFISGDVPPRAYDMRAKIY